MAFVPPFDPDDATVAAAMLAYAAGERMAVVPAGHGTKSNPDPRAVVMSTSRLTAGLSHYAGDLVATVPAGCTLDEVNTVLSRERQWIPIDPPHADRATIGGIVATSDSGPRRHGFGSPRDLIIGIEVALTSGTVARSGGRVVKNVAGYDLGRLFCGSRGSLGLITSVTFKLAPIAPASRTVVARYARSRDALAAALELTRTASLTPSAVELSTPDTRLLVRFETTARAADLMASSAAVLLEGRNADVEVLQGADEQSVWDGHQRAESSGEGLRLAVSVVPASAAALFDDLDRLAGGDDVSVSVTGRAAMGVFRIQLAGADERLLQSASLIQQTVRSLGGHAEIVPGSAITGVATGADDTSASARATAWSVKQRFDPAGILPWPWTAPAGAPVVQA